MTTTKFSTDEHGNTTVTNPYADCRFQLMQLRSALGLEIKTGLKMSQGSTLAFLNTHSVREDGQPISSKRTKRGAYADLNAVCVEMGLQDRPLT